MGTTHRALGVVLSVLLASPSPSLFAGDCSKVVDEIQSEAQAFHSEAKNKGIKFTADQYVGPALDKAKEALDATGDEAVEQLQSVKDAKDKLDGWRDTVDAWKDFLENMSACLDGGPPGCLTQLAGKVNEEMREWVQSVADDGVAAAAKRVDEAASFVNDYASRLGSAATGKMSAAVSCMDEHVQQQQAAKDPVDLRDPPRSGGTSTPTGGTAPAGGAAAGAGGGGGGTLLLVAGGLALAGGAILAADAVSKAADEAACPSASEVEQQTGGQLRNVGGDLCTQTLSCGRSTFRTCLSNHCSTTSCSAYYVVGSSRFACSANCNSADFGAALQPCAQRAVNACN